MASVTTNPRGGDNLPHLTAVTPAEDARTVMLNRISWSAVLAGAATALVTQLLLNMLAVGVGMATLDPLAGDSPSAKTFSIAAGLWWIASGIFAAGVGGYVAGRASGKPVETTAALHGLTAWAASTLVVMYLLTTAIGSLAGGALGAVSGIVGGLGRTAATAAQTVAPALGNVADPFGAIEGQMREAGGGNDPAALRDSAIGAVRSLLTGDAAGQTEARERAAQALARAQNVPVEEARTRIGQYEQQYRQAVETAKRRAAEAADATAKAVSRGALFAFFGLLLGALAGWYGGRAGRVEPIVTSDAAGFGGRG
ncbi:PhnA-like protein [uncultured Enterovirga sp.]|uniref:PhnA-like protein n=1 Tax=uncultured Enterovirga sp. TaxID=2026352 RepID=UPI0035CCA956